MKYIKIGITGHQNIPDQAIAYVKDGIKSFILQADNKVLGISSLAAGADQLFAEMVLELEGQLRVIVPSAKYEDTFSDQETLNKFNTLFNKAISTKELRYSEPSEEAFLNAGYNVVDESDIILAIWDGQKAQGKGGTADIVLYAQAKNKEVFILWPTGVVR